MAETPTTTITTPFGNHKVELKTFVSGYDKEEIDDAFYNAFTEEDEKLTPTKRANRKSFERIVVSIDGNKDNIVTKILEMEANDYEAVVKKINEISEGPPAKKKSSSRKTT